MGRDMKKILPVLLIISLLVSCAATGVMPEGGSSGTFRGRWYNYYDRGLTHSEKEVWQDAEQNLKKTISMRPKDQRMARTYGMHFIDYFPHRELGIVHLNKGEINDAIRELEESISHEESAKAVFYLNKARKSQLINEGIKPEPPAIKVQYPEGDTVINNFTLKVKGEISGEGYISKISVNDEPYRFDLARKEITFEKEISVPESAEKITIVTEDLLGNVSAKTIPFKVDRDGPAINIFDIASETVSGREGVRIRGEVNDATGLGSVVINGKTEAVTETKSYEFDILAEKKSSGGKFIIQASDTLYNTTTAELDIEKELTASDEKPEPVLLAFSGSDIFSTDKKPPVIIVKDGLDIPPVFVDKYYVEGEVSDESKVEQITVNKRDIFSRKGRKIFFSKLVKLDEGKNRIDIEAFDSSGNRSASDFTVTRTIPEVRQVGSRMSMSIMPFETQKKETTTELLAYEELTGSFVEQKRFNVIEREKLEHVLLEQKLTREKLTDPEYSIKVGRLMAADTILATSVAEGQKSLEFTSRVINTETSQIMEVKDVYSEDVSPDSVRQMMDGLASKVAGGFPLVEGMVIKRENNIVYTDLGAGTGIKGNMGIIVYRKGKEIRHPMTGKLLGTDMETVGAADIEEIHAEFSKAKLSDRKASNDVKVQDMVITR